MGGRRVGGVVTRPVVPATDVGLAGRFALAVLIVVLQVGDVVTTRMLLMQGGEETNPFARFLMTSGSFEPTKVVLAGVVGLLILAAPLRRGTQRVVLAVVALYAVLLA